MPLHFSQVASNEVGLRSSWFTGTVHMWSSRWMQRNVK